jgi:DNA-binding transcriptional regulator GbsR (MarR family)
MPNQSSPEIQSMRRLAGTVGNFIRYWGFRRIHGQIWTQVYLSQSPLSGADLTRLLNVSKALVSPALAELESYKLIFQVTTASDSKTKRYKAHPEVFKVIKQILKTRERKMIKETQAEFEKVQKMVSKSNSNIDLARLEALGSMISTATQAIDLMVELPDFEHFAVENSQD